jgi:hypothetical protein
MLRRARFLAFTSSFAPPISARDWRGSKEMRAETERTIGEIKQALALLRRHL